jgi:pimeloyl-ACP methyl ester carboxylesterase
MAVAQVRMEHAGDPSAHRHLARLLDQTPGDAPVAVLVHGLRAPGANLRPCPHRHIFAPLERPAELSWPARLGLAGQDGVAISYEWPARGGLRGVFRKAAAAGENLAALLTHLRAKAPGRRMTLIGHSMGAEVILCAVAALREPAADLAIVLSGVANRARAIRASGGPAGRAMRFLNVSAAENRLFDLLLAAAIGDLTGAPLAADMAGSDPRWSDLRLGDPEALVALGALGHPVAGPERRICHLSTYTRPGALGLYGALIHRRLTPEALAAALPPRARLSGSRHPGQCADDRGAGQAGIGGPLAA